MVAEIPTLIEVNIDLNKYIPVSIPSVAYQLILMCHSPHEEGVILK
jgi:hypothetical protein